MQMMNIISGADDPVACNFDEDLCSWHQDVHYDLSDWELEDGKLNK